MYLVLLNGHIVDSTEKYCEPFTSRYDAKKATERYWGRMEKVGAPPIGDDERRLFSGVIVGLMEAYCRIEGI